jgi:hypothetical protein
MIYDTSNAAGSRVFWVKDGVELELVAVMMVDMDGREVIQYEQPLRIVGNEPAWFKTEFEFISVTHETGTQYTFRCYGKRTF